jgi:hypothetical protein
MCLLAGSRPIAAAEITLRAAWFGWNLQTMVATPRPTMSGVFNSIFTR